jgi:hypothetical protein
MGLKRATEEIKMILGKIEKEMKWGIMSHALCSTRLCDHIIRVEAE